MNRKVAMVSIMLASLALAGCTDSDDGMDEPAMNEGGSSVQVGDNQTLTFGPHSGLPRERAADWAPSLEEPPQWTLGEWWTIEVTDGFVGTTHEVTRIAAGKEGQDLLVGMPLEEFNDEVMVLHFPCFGLVGSDDLGCEAHDHLFEPLKFPLEEGDTWDSLWQSTNAVTHLVESVDEAAMTATISMSGATGGTYTYDATKGVITEFNVPGYESYKVVDHGFDYEGIVRVPYSHDMTIYHGRAGPAVTMQQSSGVLQTVGLCPTQGPFGGCADLNAPIETFTIPEEGASGVVYDRASFALIIFDLGGVTGQSTPAGAGVSSITATAPDGTTYEATKLPVPGGHLIEGYGHDQPAGDWELQIVAGGAYAVFIEGITYTTFDVDLPSGCVVLTKEVHDHGGECGGHVHGIE